MIYPPKTILIAIALPVVAPVDDNVPELKESPVPTVTLLNPPELLPYKIDVPLVAGA